MPYSANYLTNPSAETQDTSGWSTNGTVTVLENQAVEDSNYQFEVDNHEYWHSSKHFCSITGGLGTYHFHLAPNSYIEQTASGGTLGASDATIIKIETTFKLPTPQNDWDANVLGKAIAYMNYDDGSRDLFFTPLVRGINYSGHNLTNFWFYVASTCNFRAGKTLSSVKVKIIADSGLLGGLDIDIIYLKQFTES